MRLTWASMSEGWSPTGTLVIPGKSTNVKSVTEKGIEMKIEVLEQRKKSK